MPPIKVQCTNCDDAPLRECDVDGELAGYVCSGASESELESRSGCGALVSTKEYREMKAAAEAKAGGKSSAAVKSSAPTTPAARTLAPSLSAARPMGGGMRRPLSSLHGRSSLHAKPAAGGALGGAKPSSSADSTSAASAAVAASAVAAQPASSSPRITAAKPAAPKPVAAPAAKASTAEGDDSSDDSDDDDDGEGGGGGDDDTSSGEEGQPPRSSASVTSTSTTPTKLPPPPPLATTPAKAKPNAKKPSQSGSKKKNNASSPALSSTADPTLNLSDPTSRADRMRALKAKLAAKHAAAQEEFESKYGAEGDADTAEERAEAARKSSGQAEEDFDAACLSQGDDAGIQRAPLMNTLSIKGAENPLAERHRKAWAPPRAFGAMSKEAVKLVEARQKAQFVVGRRLGARARPLAGSFTGFKQLTPPDELTPPEIAPPPPPVLVKSVPKDTDAFEPLVIWEPTPEELAVHPQLTTIEVPHLVCKWLRPHQREGVKFMCECVLGQKNLGGQEKPVAPLPPPPVKDGLEKGGEGEGEGEGGAPPPPPAAPAAPSPAANLGAGAILADDMGLGKTLQSVALLYTLLTQGFEVNHPVARKVIIVTPTSLVANWRNEIDKWLGKGVLQVVALSEVGKDNIECGLDDFTGPRSKYHVLIISYDTFRRYVDRLKKPGLCDLLICDEAHRLKNNKTSTYIALDSLPTRRRVLLSGTPMQNDLSEFFSMVNFTNRRVIGDQKAFRKYYELPILLGREPEALEQEAEEGAVRSAELSAIVNQFVLRRTNILLKKHLPPKVIQVVCCRPSALQVQLYQHFLASKSVRHLTSGDGDDGEGSGKRGGGGLQALPLITSLKKLCQHPKLIFDTANAAASSKGKGGMSFKDADSGLVEKVPPALMAMFKSMRPIFERYDSGNFIRNPSLAAYSGKMYVLERLLLQVRASSTDRFVIVSNFTSALDVIAQMCAARKWDALRLDGSTSIKKRQQLVDQLSDHRGNKVFCFLLSSRAGGCGLNLIGANRLVLFDPDWNPAVDKQAAARVWRDGQTKRCFIYRFLTTGTIEEKIYQRQLSKEGLSGVLGGSTADASLTKDELRDLFQLDQNALEQPSDTHHSLSCDCMVPYQIRTEEEAAKADEAQKAEAEIHAKQVAAAEAERRKAELEENGGEAAAMDDAEPGAPVGDAAAAAAGPPDQIEGAAAAGDTAMSTGEGDDAEGGEAGGDAVPSSDSDDGNDDDGADLDGFVVEGSGDDDDEEFGSKPKGGAKSKSAAKKPSKKDGPRKQRKKRATIGSLNFPQLHALTNPTLGQRGEPPEEELINWAHHATSNSIPDPVFRTATRNMPLGSNKLPYVSFVFSCEIDGKAIVGSSDADDALKVSAMSSAAPEKVAASKPLTVSAADAMAKHAEFMRNYMAKQKKRAGVDEDEDMPDLVAHPELRRHSARTPKPVRNPRADEPDAPEPDDDFVDGEGGSATASRKRKSTSSAANEAAAQFHPDALNNASGMDDESRALIQQLLAQDSGLQPKKGRGRSKAPAKVSPKQSPRKQPVPEPTPEASDEGRMSDIDEEGEEGEGQQKPAVVAPSHAKAADSSSDVQEVSPKKARVAPPTHSAPTAAVSKRSPTKAPVSSPVLDDDSDSSSVQEVEPPPAAGKHAPAALSLPQSAYRSPAHKPASSKSSPARSSLSRLPSPAMRPRAVDEHKAATKPVPAPMDDTEDDFLD